jgi:sulfiredoxin
MMKRETFAIANIYVPLKRRATLDTKKAQEIAESILQVGLQTPILVRQDGERSVLVDGLHRLEACKQLREQTIVGYGKRPVSGDEALGPILRWKHRRRQQRPSIQNNSGQPPRTCPIAAC